MVSGIDSDARAIEVPAIDRHDVPFGYAWEIQVDRVDGPPSISLEVVDEAGNAVDARLLEPVWLIEGIAADGRLVNEEK